MRLLRLCSGQHVDDLSPDWTKYAFSTPGRSATLPLGNGMAGNSEGVDFMQPLGAAWPCRGAEWLRGQGTRAGTAIFFHESDKTIHSRTLLDPMPSTLNHEEAYGGSVGFLHGDRGSGQSASAPRGSMIRRWAPPCRAAGSPRHRCMRDVVDEVEQVCFGSIRAESLGNAASGYRYSTVHP